MKGVNIFACESEPTWGFLLVFFFLFAGRGLGDVRVWFLVKLDLHHALRQALEFYFDSEVSSYPELEIG